MPANFQLQQENGIFIKSWVGDPKDTSLKEMSLFLTDLAKNTSTDIRIGLKATRKKKDEENPVLNLSV